MTAPAEPPPRRDRPALVGAATDGAAFLDAPGLQLDEVLDAAYVVLAGMPSGAILTVHTDDPAARDEAAVSCVARGIELLAVIDHEHAGTTLALRRADAAAGDAPVRATGA